MKSFPLPFNKLSKYKKLLFENYFPGIILPQVLNWQTLINSKPLILHILQWKFPSGPWWSVLSVKLEPAQRLERAVVFSGHWGCKLANPALPPWAWRPAQECLQAMGIGLGTLESHWTLWRVLGRWSIWSCSQESIWWTLQMSGDSVMWPFIKD